jgi:carboxypeptidase Ss1
MDVLSEAKAVDSETIKTRRAIHQHPELSYHEKATARMVAERLRSLGIQVKEGIGGTGVLGILKGSKPGKVVGLRADMDALPVEETADVEFRSKAKGVMHACGHDTHVAMLLAAARILAEHKNELRGTVKFLFQPAEEQGGRGGAKPMIEAGVMTGPKVDYVFGLHIEGTTYRSGEFAVRQGAIMAAPDSFKIRVIGKGGHGAYPHETIDPIYIAGQLIVTLQGVSGRMIDPVQPFVVSVCNIHAGTKDNIIPDEAILEGTIRTLDEKTRASAKAHVRKMVTDVTKAFGGRAEIQFMEDAYPVTVNHPETAARVAELLATIPGATVKTAAQVMGGEDFSRFLLKAPGTFYFLGSRNDSKGCIYPNHSSKFKVDEDVLRLGAASLALLAMEFGNPRNS